MKLKSLLLTTLCVLCLTSCIKDDPLYREADITSFTLDEKIMVSSNISDNKIQIVVVEGTDYKSLVPTIFLSPGAIVTPASGETIDFTNDVVYKVVSEDGKYSKEYTVSVTSFTSMKHDFEEWELAGALWKYPVLKDITWSSANLGIAIAKTGKVDRYPTRDTIDAHTGEHAAVLETLFGGGKYWGNYIPIFSGSLFTGKFQIVDTNNVLTSTHFGQVQAKESGKPLELKGYYKYKRGKEFIDSKGDTIPNKMDEFSISAVLYKVAKDDTGKDEYLDGTNIQTSDKIIAKAILEDSEEKEEYTYFSIPLEYTEEMNYEQHAYKLAIVLASSKRGNYYEGAPGSMLIIDSVEVVCEEIKE